MPGTGPGPPPLPQRGKMDPMRVELLGPLRVRDDAGAEVAIPAGRQRALLARLALEPGRAVPAAALIDALWPADPPANAAGALHTQLSRLRGPLGAHLESGPGGYRLTGVRTDVETFEQMSTQTEAASREDSPATVRDRAEAALALWRGPALADLDGYEFAEAARAGLAMRREAVAALHIDARLRLDGADAVLADLAARHVADPLHEPDAARYMRALAAAGRRAEALAVFESVRAALADELGVDPAAVLRDAHLDVLRGIEPVPSQKTTRLPQPLTACIGREPELAALPNLLEANRLVTLIGPGGTGKTRLAVETAHRLAAEGREVRLVELAPVADATRLPEVFIDAIGSGESILTRRAEDPRTRLTDALWGRDLIVAVDNCEHLIEDVAELLVHLLARVPGLRVLATSREALGITGEAVLGVGPLPLPERREPLADLRSHAAIRLFEERARQSDREFAVDAANAGTVLQRVHGARRPAARHRARGGPSARHSPWRTWPPAYRRPVRPAGARSAHGRAAAAHTARRRRLELGAPDPAEAPGARPHVGVQRRRGPGGGLRGVLGPRRRHHRAGREVARAAPARRPVPAAGDRARVRRRPPRRSGRDRRPLRAPRPPLRAARRRRRAAPHAGRAGRLARPDRHRPRQLLRGDPPDVAAGNARSPTGSSPRCRGTGGCAATAQEGQELAVQVRALPDDDPAEPLHRAKVAMAGSWGLWAGRLDPSEIDAEFERPSGSARSTTSSRPSRCCG